jgi:hypothetical protein
MATIVSAPRHARGRGHRNCCLSSCSGAFWRFTAPPGQIAVFGQRPWFVIVSPVKRALASGVVALAVFWGGGALDVFVTRNYLPRISLMLAGALIALVVGTLVFRILTDVHTRYAAMHERLERIAALNHEIRNGLQVIAYHNASMPGAPVSAEVNAAVAQIEAALREISFALRERE